MIDDSESDQLYTEVVFSRDFPGVNFASVYDGDEALEFLKKGEFIPDLILLDINMPKMDGHEFLAEYSKKNRDVPPVIVMLTSSDNQKDKDKTSVYRCVKDYLIKPIRQDKIEELKALLESLK